MRSYMRRRPCCQPTALDERVEQVVGAEQPAAAISIQDSASSWIRSHEAEGSTAGPPTVNSERWSGVTPSIVDEHLFAGHGGRFLASGADRTTR